MISDSYVILQVFCPVVPFRLSKTCNKGVLVSMMVQTRCSSTSKPVVDPSFRMSGNSISMHQTSGMGKFWQIAEEADERSTQCRSPSIQVRTRETAELSDDFHTIRVHSGRTARGEC